MTTKATLKAEIEQTVEEIIMAFAGETGMGVADWDKKLHNRIGKILAQAEAKTREESFIKGFIAGFDHSDEGYNGEYTHKKITDEMLKHEAIEALQKEDV